MKEIFTSILNISISASMLIAVCILVRLVFKKMPKSIRCIMWLLVGIRLAVPFAIESPFSLLPAKDYVVNKQYSQGESVKESIEEGSIKEKSETVNNMSEADSTSTVIYVNSTINPDKSEKAIELSTGNNDKLFGLSEGMINISFETRLMSVLSYIWLAGVLSVLVYACIAYIRLRKSVDDAVKLRENIYQTEKAGTAFILGIIRPRIYVPYGLEASELYMAISHEKAHLARYDHFIKPLGFIVAAVYWFNPVIWIAYILLCRDIELACDEKVIRKIGYDKKKEYSQALLNMSIPRRYISACPVAFGEVGINERVKNVLNMNKGKKIIIAAALAVCGVLAICFLTYPKNSEENKAVTETSEEIASGEDNSIDNNLEENASVSNTDTADAEISDDNTKVVQADLNDEDAKVAELQIKDDDNDGDIKEIEIQLDDSENVAGVETSDKTGAEAENESGIKEKEETSEGSELDQIFVEFFSEEEGKVYHLVTDAATDDAGNGVSLYLKDGYNSDAEAEYLLCDDCYTEFSEDGTPLITFNYASDDSGDASSGSSVKITNLTINPKISKDGKTVVFSDVVTDENGTHIYLTSVGLYSMPFEEGYVIARGYSEEHQGVDFAAEEGTSIMSVMSGTVEETGFDDERGYYIIIKGDDRNTYTYSHLQEEATLTKGRVIGSRVIIGKVGSTGQSTGPHLHLEVKDANGDTFDPMTLLGEK